MTSHRKIKANRANARRSTGPRSASGKARSSFNALRHGLARTLDKNPEASAEVEALARRIAHSLGGGIEADDGEILALARAVARAFVRIQLVRRHRHNLISYALTDPAFMPLDLERRHLALSMAVMSAREAGRPVGHFGMRLLAIEPPHGPGKPAIVIDDVTRRLVGLERYETRARSALRSALRALVIFRSARRTCEPGAA